MIHQTFADTAAFAHYTRATHAHDHVLASFKHGWDKRLNTMRRRLSAFFHMTGKELVSGSLRPMYAHARNQSGQLTPALITLTYPSNDVWSPKHISQFLDTCKKHALRQWDIKLRYCWVAETTKAGVIHYHVVVWLPRTAKLPKPDKQGWWPWGHSEISSVRKGVYSYLMKYISKGCDIFGLQLSSETKSGRRQAARMFGYGGLLPQDREHITHQMLPAYIKDIFGFLSFGAKIQRERGGWRCKNHPDWGDAFIASNFESAWHDTMGVMIYEYGVSWSALPETKDALFIPF